MNQSTQGEQGEKRHNRNNTPAPTAEPQKLPKKSTQGEIGRSTIPSTVVIRPREAQTTDDLKPDALPPPTAITNLIGTTSIEGHFNFHLHLTKQGILRKEHPLCGFCPDFQHSLDSSSNKGVIYI